MSTLTVTATNHHAVIELNAKCARMEKIGDAIDCVNRLQRRRNDERTSTPDSCDSSSGQYAQSACKAKEDFRNYDAAAVSIKQFYIEQHTKQTVAFVKAARQQYLERSHARMTVWQALEMLNALVDESDPDTSLSQIQHLLQTAEAIRLQGLPDWMQLTGLLHDLGKLLVFFGAEGQWDVVGDTFVIGCAFSKEIIYSDTFANNPDQHDPRYNTACGMYEPGCGIDNLLFSWGHDEYMYWRMKTQSTLPRAALDMIRLHSCYPLHREGAYKHLLAPGDEERLAAVRQFNAFDLYSKSDCTPDPVALRPYYEALIDKYIIGGRDALLEW